MYLDDTVLDNKTALETIDQGNMLECVASSGAQLRRGVQLINRDALEQIAAGGKPRAIVVAGMGGSGVSGEILSAVVGSSSPLPIIVEKSHTLPGWVSPLDLVIAVSCSGSTEETLSVASEASRRGSRLVTVGAAGSPISQISEQTTGAIHLDIDAQGRMPRASLWTIATPLLLLADAIGVTEISDDVLAQTADLMDAISVACGPSVSVIENPAKLHGVAMAESVPMVWGTGNIGRASAGRLMAQLAENAKLPAVYGELPEVGHNQIVSFDGVFATKPEDDMFEDPENRTKRIHLTLLRDSAEHPAVVRRVELVRDITARRELAVTEITSQGTHPLTRIASLVVPTDWASVYAALAMGIDPSPIGPIVELKNGLSQ